MAARYYRKIIRIRAEDSPNVIRALEMQKAGLDPDGATILPGVLTWAEYKKRRATWDIIRQTVGLDGLFYEGPQQYLFPASWIALANRRADLLRGTVRKAKAIGIDPAEGGDSTAMAAVDEFGIIELVSEKTPDTNEIVGKAFAFMRKHQVPPERLMFDRGGGGKQHADRMRAAGYPVRTVGFGEAVQLEPKRGLTRVEERKEIREEHYAYLNLRAQMYGQLRLLLDPSLEDSPRFAIPACYTTLYEEMSPVPLKYDAEGRLFILPKNKKTEESTLPTLTELIGHSPDELDAFVLAIHAMLHKARRPVAGVA